MNEPVNDKSTVRLFVFLRVDLFIEFFFFKIVLRNELFNEKERENESAPQPRANLSIALTRSFAN